MPPLRPVACSPPSYEGQNLIQATPKESFLLIIEGFYIDEGGRLLVRHVSGAAHEVVRASISRYPHLELNGVLLDADADVDASQEQKLLRCPTNSRNPTR